MSSLFPFPFYNALIGVGVVSSLPSLLSSMFENSKAKLSEYIDVCAVLQPMQLQRFGQALVIP